MKILQWFLLIGALLPALSVAATITVPGKWSDATRQSVGKSGGWAWYRSWLKPADSFFTPHERNLFEESVGLTIADLTGAYEVFVNGRSIGTGGGFPPSYRDGSGQTLRHKVPVGTLRKGEWNELAILVYLPAGRQAGGFLGDAPFIMDYFRECVLAGPWELHVGRDRPPGTSPEQPATAAFDQFRESNRVLSRTVQEHGPSLPPAEAAAAVRARPGLIMEQLLADPLIAQPFHLSFDERGRIWVTHSKQYPYPAGLRMISRDKYYRAHYDRVPPAPPRHDRGADLVTIHESTKQDGVYDRHTVFQDGLNMANAALRGHGGVWVMHTPYLLFYPDADFDDVPDGPPEVRLAGFGMEDSHAIANGLAWGPDGWLYGAQGSTSSCSVTRPEDPPGTSPASYTGCMIWRYHPRSRAFEIFAEGGGNNFGLEFDAVGRLFGGHNGGGTRGFHFVQGGRYRMRGTNPGKYGPASEPFAFGELPQLATDDTVVRFTHHGALADGTAMPDETSGHLFSLDPLHNLITEAEMTPRGSTFQTTDLTPAVRAEDEAFRPVFIANAPDGSLFVCDMYEYFIAHGQHYQNQIDPTTGRIYRLRGSNKPLETQTDLTGLTTTEYLALLNHPNKWHRQTAVRLLAESGDRQAAGRLRELIGGNDETAALHAVWALDQLAGLDPATVKTCLSSPCSAVRRWAVRLLGDRHGLHRGRGCGPHSRGDGRLPEEIAQAVIALARGEVDPGVLCQVLATARRLAADQAISLTTAVLARDEEEFVSDPYLPMMGWWALEALIPADNQAVLDAFTDSAIWSGPIIRETILPRLARRYALEDDRDLLAGCTRLLRLAPDQQSAARLLDGLLEAVRGRSLANLPDELLAAVDAAGTPPLAFRLRRGDPAAVAEAAARIIDGAVAPEERISLIRTLAEGRVTVAVEPLTAIALNEQNASEPVRAAALSGLGQFADPSIGSRVAAALPQLDGSLRMTAMTLLASRPAWSRQLLDALDAGRVAASGIPADVAERLRQHSEQDIRAAAARLMPLGQTPAEPTANRIAELTAVLAAGSGNPYEGRTTFLAKCSQCHRLFHEGGNVGPVLTTYQRDNLQHLLRAIVAPSDEIREGYAYHALLTDDGRSLTGFIVDRDASGLRLRTLDGETVSLSSDEIDELVPLGKSLMPPGLLDDLKPQQVRDLFAYLRARQPIAPPTVPR